MVKCSRQMLSFRLWRAATIPSDGVGCKHVFKRRKVLAVQGRHPLARRHGGVSTGTRFTKVARHVGGVPLPVFLRRLVPEDEEIRGCVEQVPFNILPFNVLPCNDGRRRLLTPTVPAELLARRPEDVRDAVLVHGFLEHASVDCPVG